MDNLFDINEVDNLNRIKELEEKILHYQKSYYNGEGEISDADFDLLWDELKSIDPSNSILHKVGTDSGNFIKSTHIMPMGSQEKAANPEQFLLWADKHVYGEYFVEYKLDGASLELQYENGHLLKAVTRGDGTIGDVITENAKKMNGVIVDLSIDGKKINYSGGVRGEVIMTHSVHHEKFSDKANCRNAANGIMKRKDGEGSEFLKLIVYDAFSPSDIQPFSDEEEKIIWLKKCGFCTVDIKVCHSPQEVIDYRSSVMEKRKTLEYDIDGLVIKERVINKDDAFRARPDRQIAFKFSLDEAVSVLRNVEWSKSGGTYTPIALFDEVELNGTTVQRASLANPDTLRALNVKIGSKVVVVKRGEIIPKIENVVFEDNSVDMKEIEFPKKCETCGTELIDEGSRLFCPNKKCPKRILHQLLKWQQVVDIRDFGVTLIESLFNDKKLLSISDIYSISKDNLIPYFLNEESILKEKKSLGAEKVYNSIHARTELKLSTFIAGFDIEGIGVTSTEKLVQAGYDTLDKILSLTKEQIALIYGFADKMALIIEEGLKENASEMRYLVENNIITIKSNQNGLLFGLSFCFTGELQSIKRTDAQLLVTDNGGIIKSSVTKDLNYLVTNDTESGSSKNQKAAKYNVTIINEKQFLALLRK